MNNKAIDQNIKTADFATDILRSLTKSVPDTVLSDLIEFIDGQESQISELKDKFKDCMTGHKNMEGHLTKNLKALNDARDEFLKASSSWVKEVTRLLKKYEPEEYKKRMKEFENLLN